MRRAQVSQVFTYIFAAVVFATILIFGYKAINSFIHKGDEFAFAAFTQNLGKAVNGIRSDFGSVAVYDARNPLNVPGGIKQICFVDMDTPASSDCPSDLGIIGCDSWKTYCTEDSCGGWDSAEANVFFTPPSPNPLKLGRLKIDSDSDGAYDLGYLCFITHGRLDFRLAGKGSYTLIAPVQT